MNKKDAALQALLAQKLLPLYYNDSAEVSVGILKGMYEGGIRLLEYVARGENALQNFSVLRKAVDESMPGMLLGIGTIKNAPQALQYIEAGADFIVSPSVNVKVADVTHEAGLLWIPGCMTPTEISTAEEAGATLVKLFPENLLGPSFLSSIKELFPALKFMPTGGVESEIKNLNEWFNAGVVAVGMGSKLITKELVNNKDYKGITIACVDVLRLIRQAKA